MKGFLQHTKDTTKTPTHATPTPSPQRICFSFVKHQLRYAPSLLLQRSLQGICGIPCLIVSVGDVGWPALLSAWSRSHGNVLSEGISIFSSLIRMCFLPTSVRWSEAMLFSFMSPVLTNLTKFWYFLLLYNQIFITTRPHVYKNSSWVYHRKLNVKNSILFDYYTLIFEEIRIITRVNYCINYI